MPHLVGVLRQTILRLIQGMLIQVSLKIFLSLSLPHSYNYLEIRRFTASLIFWLYLIVREQRTWRDRYRTRGSRCTSIPIIEYAQHFPLQMVIKWVPLCIIPLMALISSHKTLSSANGNTYKARKILLVCAKVPTTYTVYINILLVLYIAN